MLAHPEQWMPFLIIGVLLLPERLFRRPAQWVDRWMDKHGHD